MKGWSLQELADALNNSITKQALHKYESGAMNPSAEILMALSKALDVKPDYLLRESTVSIGTVDFRKKTSLSVKQIDSIKEKVKEHLERYIEVENLLQEDKPFNNPLKDIIISELEDVESAVNKLIKKWELGNDPIPNVVEMLEEHLIRVIEIDAPEDFDGLSTYVGKIPVVVVNTNFSIERKRFTALHELGHLVLNIEEGLDAEKVCHSFAGAMLLPGDSLVKAIGEKRKNIAPGELVSIKEQYGISIQAIIMRAEVKGIIDRNAASRLWKFISTNRKEIDMGQFRGNEKSFRLLRLVSHLAAEEIISTSKAANLLNMKIAEFRNHLEANTKM